MFHSSSQERSTASHRTLEKGILRVMIAEKQQMLLRMRRISCFVIIVINHNILKRLVGDFVVTQIEVKEVVLVVLLDIRLITLH